MSTIHLNVDGMHCASCVARVESALMSVDDVVEAHVNLATNQATVQCARDSVNVQQLLSAVTGAGYPAAQIDTNPGERDDRRHHQQVRYWLQRVAIGVVCLVPLIWLHHLVRPGPTALAWWTFLLATPVQIFVGWPYFRGAWERLRHGSVNMDSLVALGTGVAYLHGVAGLMQGTSVMSLVDAAMILSFISLGKYLEARARGRASQAIYRLLDLTPDEAMVVRSGQTVVVRPEDVRVGEQIVVRPGDRVPLDATIVTGQSEADESWLTGESLPVAKRPGSPLLAGTINGQGALTATVTQTAGSTTLDRVIELVRRAQESKADVQRLADQVVGWFVPVVLALAVSTLAAWWVVAADWRFGLSCAVAVLVVACPCALGLATPMAVIVGTGRGAEAGILIKDARVLEIAGRLDTVILDKTGTITTGAPHIAETLPADHVSEDDLLATAAAVEQLSSHPLAAAVVRLAEARGLAWQPATNMQVIPGAGIRADYDGRQILLGNDDLFERFDVAVPHAVSAVARHHREAGRQALSVAIDDAYAGTLIAEDTITSHADQAIAALTGLGLRVLMLSGDRRATAERIAAAVGINEVIAEVLPEDKEGHVRHLREQGRVVAMVGDGINDAPALATADLGIALGTGADVAIETADMVLVEHDLRAVAAAICLARRTLRTIRQNLFWAFAYNVLLLPLAAGALVPWFGVRVPPSLAAAAMAASSVSVVMNSLRLRWWRFDER